jgi:uncharacterized protein (TIGR04255 family)
MVGAVESSAHNMAERIKFGSPPVIETALSVQFNTLAGFTAAHSGWFWKEYVEKLGDSEEWKQVVEAPKIPEVFERFGVDDVWIQPSLRVVPGVVSSRVQIIRRDGERMIQMQDNRFILNWRKQASAYPSFQTLLPEFRNMLNAFESFCLEAGFGKPVYNLWEVVYVDQVKKGMMWDSARNLDRIFPALTPPSVSAHYAPPSDDETISADWRFSLANRRGRLYVQVRQARLQQSNEEVIQLTTTARGPVSDAQSWEQGLDFGHEALRETFLAITSTEAQELWKKGS